jgi:hypothetical protein
MAERADEFNGMAFAMAATSKHKLADNKQDFTVFITPQPSQLFRNAIPDHSYPRSLWNGISPLSCDAKCQLDADLDANYDLPVTVSPF